MSLHSSSAAARQPQHVIVIGAGVVGVSTALQLALAGHRVEVFEAAAAAAHGASYANAGLISPGHCFSWAEPGALGVFVRSLFGKADGLGVTRWWSPRLWRWGWRFYQHSSAARWEQDSRAALALSAYSRNVHFSGDSARAIGLDSYGGAQQGILYLYQKGQSARAIEQDMLRQAGEACAAVDAAGLSAIEPALDKAEHEFVRGLYCPQDATGNARRYAEAAEQRARELGVAFHFNTPVVHLQASNGKLSGIVTPSGTHSADHVVLSAGLASAALARPLGYALPIYPVTGYSMTFEHVADVAPTVGAVSLADKIAWAGFGPGVIRFTGFADIGPRGGAGLTEKRFAALRRFALRMYPQLEKAVPHTWVGQRPMTPDGIPVLGRSAHANLWFNCGHGAMGWTMSSGCAQIISDLIGGEMPAIDCQPYHWERFA